MHCSCCYFNCFCCKRRIYQEYQRMPTVTFRRHIAGTESPAADYATRDRDPYKPKSASLAKLNYLGGGFSTSSSSSGSHSPRQPSPLATTTTTTIIRTTARSPCKNCGHQNTPSMSRAISPLARSQNNLELVETANARQALIPVSPAHTNHDSMYSLSPPGPQTLHISRRPSVLLQEILTRARRGNDHNGLPKSPKNLCSVQGTNTGSMVTINHSAGGDGARSYQAKQSKEKNRRQGNDAVSAALSAIYCKVLVLLGVCLPVTEVISDQIPTYVYQGFYVYLYAVSVIFVIFLYVTAFRNKTLFNALKDFHERNNNVHLKRKVTHFGSFYLRVGAIAFAIGTVVYSGLEFGQFFELNGQPGCHNPFVAITPLLRMALCVAQIQFIFLNTTYIDMAYHKVTARFGLMHMVGTNLCEWLYVLVEETKHEIFHISHHDEDPAHDPVLTGGSHGGVDWVAVNASLYAAAQERNQTFNHMDSLITNITANAASAALNHTMTGNPRVSCTRTNIMGALVQEVAPFLFPCTIEYSLICAVILYEMWKTVKSIPDIDKTRKNSIKPTQHKPAHQFSVDCSQSHKGLFFGIIVICITIISMIMYFVLYMQPGYELVATQEVTLWETCMYALCAIAICAAMYLMRDLRYVKNSSDDHHSMELDNTLLVVAQTGVYLYGMFSILGSYFSKWDTVPDRVEGIIAEVFGLAQTSLQTMFILHASHRRCKGAKQARRKPGREIITFLLVANIAIWCVNTLIKGRAVFRETHLIFFGVWGWTIITHISMPLSIFYRFHSTICLFEIWKVAYKSKSH